MTARQNIKKKLQYIVELWKVNEMQKKQVYDDDVN